MEGLEVGAGKIDLFGFAVGDFDGGRFGVALDGEARLSKTWSAWGRASASEGWGASSGLSLDALAGVRLRF